MLQDAYEHEACHYLLQLFRSHIYQFLDCSVVIQIYDSMLRWDKFIFLAIVLPAFYFSICILLFKISLNLQQTNILIVPNQTIYIALKKLELPECQTLISFNTVRGYQISTVGAKNALMNFQYNHHLVVAIYFPKHVLSFWVMDHSQSNKFLELRKSKNLSINTWVTNREFISIYNLAVMY